MQEDKLKIFVVEDHPVMRQGIVETINREADFSVCGEADDASPALSAIRAIHPAVALVDIQLMSSNGIDLMTRLVKEMPSVRIVGMTMFDDHQHEHKARAAGACVFFNKQGGNEKLISAIRKALAGDESGALSKSCPNGQLQ